MLNQGQDKLYVELINIVPKAAFANKNRSKTWAYGYNEKYNFVVISKTGEIGQIINISGLNIALPKVPKDILKRSDKKDQQYWEPKILPKELKRIKSIFQWHSTPATFKNQWVDYVENEFNYREQGRWFMNNGTPSYITGTHYMYLQWTKIDIGLPDFREANRIFLYFLGSL